MGGFSSSHTPFIGVIGSGAWGMALALAFCKAGHDVRVWGRNPETLHHIRHTKRHFALPESVEIPDSLQLTSRAEDLFHASVLICAIPTQHFREAFSGFSGFLPAGMPVIQTAKGLEYSSGLLLPDVLIEIAPQVKGFMLSGPSFAHDVACGFPTAVTLATHSQCEQDFERIVPWFQGSVLRPYLSTDIQGVALAGAFKNVVAIGCGIAIGAGLGESARASLAARGFSEMRRLNKALGGLDETLMGLAGIGDLMLTSSSVLSRNYSFGIDVGSGSLPTSALKGRTVEGITTIQALERWAETLGVELPLTHHISLFLKEEITLYKAIEQLLNRPFRGEAFF
jgi:glycerol-3-phosphate dehydrogenase (NAD(P)+)